jgi:hypothetical protein
MASRELPVGCPVKALGVIHGDRFCYETSAGGTAVLAAADHDRRRIIGLFAGRADYLAHAWPSYGADGKPNGSWAPGAAAKALMDACGARGLIDLDALRRRPR